MNWFFSLKESLQLALIGAAGVVFSGIIAALVAWIGFWITFKTSTDANREIINATRDVKAEEIAISAAIKQAEFRQQWIENLRAAIARFATTAASLVRKEQAGIPTKKYEELIYQVEYIELMLNMNEEPNQTLVADMRELMDKAVRPYDQIDFKELYKARKKVSESARKILKAEWDKLRTELKTVKQKETA